MIVIPQKPENPNSSAVVLDLGHLALVSDLRARRGGETESEIDKSKIDDVHCDASLVVAPHG